MDPSTVTKMMVSHPPGNPSCEAEKLPPPKGPGKTDAIDGVMQREGNSYCCTTLCFLLYVCFVFFFINFNLWDTKCQNVGIVIEMLFLGCRLLVAQCISPTQGVLFTCHCYYPL